MAWTEPHKIMIINYLLARRFLRWSLCMSRRSDPAGYISALFMSSLELLEPLKILLCCMSWCFVCNTLKECCQNLCSFVRQLSAALLCKLPCTILYIASGSLLQCQDMLKFIIFVESLFVAVYFYCKMFVLSFYLLYRSLFSVGNFYLKFHVMYILSWW